MFHAFTRLLKTGLSLSTVSLYVVISRCVVSLLVMGLLAGVGFGLYELRDAEKEK